MLKPNTSQEDNKEKPVDRSNNTRVARGPESFLKDIRAHIQQVTYKPALSPTYMLNGAIPTQYPHNAPDSSSFAYGSYNGIPQDLQYNNQIPPLVQTDFQNGRLYMTAAVEIVLLGEISLDNASFDIFETSMFDEWRLYAQGFHILTLLDMSCLHFQVCAEKKELLIQLSSVMTFHFSNISSSTDSVLCYFANIDHFMVIYNLVREKYPTRFIDVSGEYLYQIQMQQPPTHGQIMADIPEPSAISFTIAKSPSRDYLTEDLFPTIHVGKKKRPSSSSKPNNQLSANLPINQAKSIKRAKLSDHWFKNHEASTMQLTTTESALRSDIHSSNVDYDFPSKESHKFKQLSSPNDSIPAMVSTPPLRQLQPFASPSSTAAAKQLILLSQASDYINFSASQNSLQLSNNIPPEKDSQAGKSGSVLFFTAAEQSSSSVKKKAEQTTNAKIKHSNISNPDSLPTKSEDSTSNDKKHISEAVNTLSIDVVSKPSDTSKHHGESSETAKRTSFQPDILPKRRRGRPPKHQSQKKTPPYPKKRKAQDNTAKESVQPSSLIKKQAPQLSRSGKKATPPPLATNKTESFHSPSTKENSQDPPASDVKSHSANLSQPFSARAARALKRSISGRATPPPQSSNSPKAPVDEISKQTPTTETSKELLSVTQLPIGSIASASEQVPLSDPSISEDQAFVEQHSVGESTQTASTFTTKTELNSVAHSPIRPAEVVEMKQIPKTLSEDSAISETTLAPAHSQSDVTSNEVPQILETEKPPVLSEEKQSLEIPENPTMETSPETQILFENVSAKPETEASALGATEKVELRDAREVSKISNENASSGTEPIAADKKEENQDLKEDVAMTDAEEVAEITVEKTISEPIAPVKNEEGKDFKEDVDMRDVEEGAEISKENPSLEQIAADKVEEMEDSDKIAEGKIKEIQDSDKIALDKTDEIQDSEKKIAEIRDSAPVSKRLRPPSARGASIEHSPERQYHKNFMTPFRFEFNDNKRLDITPNDFTRLYEGEYLNDSLVNFYLKFYHQEMAKKNSEVAQSLYVFNTFFYEKLAQKDQLGQFGYSHVKSWTTKVDLFSMKYVIIPINVKMHWFLAIVYNLPALLREKKEPVTSELGMIKTPSPEGTPPVAEPEASSQVVKPGQPRPSNKPVKSEEPDFSNKFVKPEEPAPKRELVVYQNGVRVNFPIAIPKAVSSEPEVAEVKTDPVVDRDSETSAAQPHPDADTGQKSSESEQTPAQLNLTESGPPPRVSPPLFTRVTRRSTHSYTLAEPASPPPSASSRSRKVDIEDDCVVFVLDSFKSRSYTAVNRNMKEYICEEAMDKLGVTIEKSRIILKQVDVPQQNNFCDCGVYLIHYVQQFMSNPFRVVDLMAQIVNKGTNNTELKNELLSIWESSQMPRKRSNLQNEIIRWRNEAEKKKSKLMGDDLVDQQAGVGPQDLPGATTPSRKQLTQPGTPNPVSLGDAPIGLGSGSGFRSGDLAPTPKAAAAQGNGPDTSMVLSSDEDEIVVVDVMQKTTTRRKPRR